MLEHEARIGRQVDIVHAYLGVGSGAVQRHGEPGQAAGDHRALINWRVSFDWAAGGGSNTIVNTQIDAMAASIKALGTTKIMLTIYHEPESSISPGGFAELSRRCP